MTDHTDDTQTLTIALTASGGSVGSSVTCENSCDLLNRYDANRDGIIDMDDVFTAADDVELGKITHPEAKFINDAYMAQSINNLCPGCAIVITPQPVPIPPLPPEGGGDPETASTQYHLAVGKHEFTVTKTDYDTITCQIEVMSDGTVECRDVTGVSGCGTGSQRVETEGSSVRVYMKYAGGTTPVTPVTGGVCDWITSLGGWKAIMWDNVLEIYDAYLDPANHSVGFTVVWDDVLTTYDYYLDQPSGQPTTGNASDNGCGFT